MSADKEALFGGSDSQHNGVMRDTCSQHLRYHVGDRRHAGTTMRSTSAAARGNEIALAMATLTVA